MTMGMAGERRAAVAAARNDGTIARLVAADGGARHPHRARLLAGRAAARDWSDLVHALCAVHGDHPGMADEALAHGAQPAAAAWLEAAARAFAVERGRLARLVAAAGPLPSTPGQAESEAALAGQRHALGMLARSDRAGCATGAVAALVAEWQALAPLLALAAERFGIAAEGGDFPPLAEADALAATPGEARAAAFGAQQLLAQSRGAWDLLEARAAARG